MINEQQVNLSNYFNKCVLIITVSNIIIAMGCCQSEHPLANDFKSEIVTYEKKEDNSNIFEDNFYLDSVERYNVKYRPPERRDPDQQSNSHANTNATTHQGAPPINA